MNEPPPALQTHNLTIGYRAARKSDIVIANGLALTLKRGELVGLLGPNGAGKSTLLRTLAGMQKPLHGQVILSGDDAHTMPSNIRAQRLSVVLTDRPNLGLMNGHALVGLGRHPYTNWTGQLSNYDEAVIRWAVDAVHATDIADKPVMKLSDGQLQKLMIARALAQESDVILLDEPTAFLDLPHRVEAMQLLKHLAHETNRAVLLSTHDLDLALRTCDELWLMAQGTIRVGTTEDLVLNDIISETFDRDNIRFDKRTGSFSMELAQKVAIYVEGDGIPHIWTRRALERKHYTIAKTPTNICITIDESYDNPVWELSAGDQTTQYLSIKELLVAIEELTYHEYHPITG